MIMKNFKSNKPVTITCPIDKGVPFKKAKDFIGTYEEKEMKILGFIKTYSDMYDKDQYSLYVDYQNNKVMINVPAWYGAKLEEDFLNSSESPEEYFANAYVKEIVEFSTKYNSKSVNIIIY